MNSAWHTHRAAKGAGAVSVEEVVRWASAGGARVLGFDDAGVLAPGKLADIAIFDLVEAALFRHARCAVRSGGGSRPAHLRHLLVGGRVVVDDGNIPGLDLAKLRHDAARVVERLTA